MNEHKQYVPPPDLDRDAGGPVTYARPRLPGEPSFTPRAPAKPRLPALVAIALLGAGCLHTGSLADKLAEAQSYTPQAETALEGFATLIAIAREACDGAPEPKPKACAKLNAVPISEARKALKDADAAIGTAEEVLRALEPYAEFANQVLAEVPE